ncbi:MAG TPA: hypothetical protein VLG69_03490 [Candidatus Andersenbacteria bacterium]|nr:hypothetical protein [Candidatus Andersenbacteria bacterium]
MLRFLRNLVFTAGIAALLVGGLLVASHQLGKSDSKHSQVLGISQAIPSLTALLVQNDSEHGNKRVLTCSEKGCSVIAPPSDQDQNSLSDGNVWYRYVESQDAKGNSVAALEKIQKDGTNEKISQQNELVKPRGLTMSSDGTKIAYFLDNIHDNQGLTELWVYDNNQGGAKVVAENLMQKNIASKVRWNASSRVAWFLQDGTARQFITVPVQDKATPTPRFSNIDWSKNAASADSGVMDINDDGSLIAFAQPTFLGFSQLTIAKDGGSVTHQSIKGNVVFVRWMENNSLLYAVQDGPNSTFWIVNNAGERPVARMSAVLRSVHSSGSSDLAAFVADPHQGETHLYVLQISTGLVKDETIVPNFSGDTYVVQANEVQAEQDKAISQVKGQLQDTELLAFVRDNIHAVAQDPQSKAERMLVTDSPNTIYIDYTSGDLSEKRLLLVIQDAIHPQWTVLAHYVPIAGQWKREQDAQNADPKPTKLYEWEDSVSQWILKETY